MDNTTFISSLNEAQRQAVTSAAPHVLVLAGAGSGKTRVLVYRIAWLMATEGLSPYEILAVTFTNKAAAEMRERIEQLRGMPVASMWVGTFHGLAHRLLRSHWQEARLPENFQILDSDDQLRMIRRVMRSLSIDEAKWPPKQAQWFINDQKDEGVRPQSIDPGHDPFLKVMAQVYQVYQSQCDQSGMVDFAELLLRALELLRDNPDLRAHYQRRFKHVLVDEFQDTNTIQYAWLKLLSNANSGLTVVGDDDQSIYGWRGARIEHIQQFSNDYAETDVVRLEQNYRSTATILNAANAVIAKNAERLGKELWTQGEDGEPIKLYSGFNEVDEARFIADRITDLVSGEYARSDIALLYRSNAQSRVLEEALLRAQIPYRIYGGQRFFDRMEIKNALAYLRLVLHCDDDAAFERVINTPTRGIGDKTVDIVRGLARSQGCSMWRASSIAIDDGHVPARARTALHGFMQLIGTLAEGYQSLSLSELCDRVINDSTLLAFHGREKGEKGVARVENLKELVNAASEFEQDEESDTQSHRLASFLDHAALEAGDTQADQQSDAVQMMTLHASKGLEFPVVFLTGMEEGVFPSKNSSEEPGRIEEERRLCYVGITRAMKRLYVTHAECRRLYGQDHYHTLSRFVRDIPRDLIQEVRLGGGVTRPVQFHHANDDDVMYHLGAMVSHPKFGEGVVIGFEGSGPNAEVRVRFAEAGEKRLIQQYAKLDLV